MSHSVSGQEYHSHDEERAYHHRKDNGLKEKLKKAGPVHFAIMRSMGKKEDRTKKVEQGKAHRSLNPKAPKYHNGGVNGTLHEVHKAQKSLAREKALERAKK